MSSLIVEVKSIREIVPLKNADNLEVIRVGGWQVVARKGLYKAGDLVIYVPPDAMVPRELAVKWGVDKYLSFKKNAEMGRVKATRLRGCPSFGFITSIEEGMIEGQDVAEHYGIGKYEPPPLPIGMCAGQQRSEHPLFDRYTDIENLRNFTHKWDFNQDVVLTEKLHGTSSRIGFIFDEEGNCTTLVGTRRTQRDADNCGVYGLPLQKYKDQIVAMVKWIKETHNDYQQPCSAIIVYGEIFGPGVQDLTYGKEQDWRMFDVKVDREFYTFSYIDHMAHLFDIPLVPIIAVGAFNIEQLEEYAQGNSTMADHIREGIVVRPYATEDVMVNKHGHEMRSIFKVISPDYLSRKDGTEYQ